MRDKVSIEKKISVSKMAGGMVSLLVKGILTQGGKYYFIRFKLIPFMRKKSSPRLRNSSKGNRIKKNK